MEQESTTPWLDGVENCLWRFVDLATSGKITDEALEQLRQRIGVEVLLHRKPFNEEATKDTIKHFANAYGDNNPLWCDEEYAARTKHGTIVAPPTFLLSCQPAVHLGLPGVHGLWAGDDWEFFRWVRRGDSISLKIVLADVIEREGRFGGRTIQEVTEFAFYNQQNEKVATCRRSNFRTERDRARERGKYAAITKHRYTEEELKAIEEDYLKEEIRGASQRYWEDVRVGDELSPVVKGPLSSTDVIAWVVGWGGTFSRMAHGIAHEYWRRHPAAAVRDPETNAPDFPAKVHWDDAYARHIGAPGAYDIGGQRISWLAHLLTNWMGDDGFLSSFSVQLRRMNIFGDTTWCRGAVTGKLDKDGKSLVTCDFRAENQRGETTALGTAAIELPTRLSAKT